MTYGKASLNCLLEFFSPIFNILDNYYIVYKVRFCSFFYNVRSFISLMTRQLWHYICTYAIGLCPTPFTNRCCLEGFMRSLYELSINQKESSVESVILPPILPSTVSPVHSKMKRSQHCVTPLALCKYYMFSLDMLVSITSTLWLHYFWNTQLCRWLQGMT